MNVKITTKRTEPKRIKSKKRKREWKPKKGKIKSIIYDILEAIFLLSCIAGLIYLGFTM